MKSKLMQHNVEHIYYNKYRYKHIQTRTNQNRVINSKINGISNQISKKHSKLRENWNRTRCDETEMEVEEMTLVSSSMAEMRSDKRSKQRSGSGDLWANEETMDSSCATSTPNRDSGAGAIWFFDMRIQFPLCDAV